MIVDSNAPWIGLTPDLAVASLADLHAHPQLRRSAWHDLARASIDPIFLGDFTYVIGLYSRHGRFYPPYGLLPDVNFLELAYNLTE